jgi:hypothetical protein
MHFDVVENRIDLGGNEIGGRQIHIDDALRVLRRQRGQNCHPIAAECRERFQVCLDPGTAGRIGAGDR